jgi:hypothetical protein
LLKDGARLPAGNGLLVELELASTRRRGELLHTLTGVYFSFIVVSVRIDIGNVNPVEISGVSTVMSKAADKRTG